MNDNVFSITKLMNGEVEYATTIVSSKYDSPLHANKAKAKLISGKDAVPVSQMINKRFEIDEIACVPSEVTGEDGEKFNTIRTVVLTKDGEIFATNSKIFGESVALILSICGMPYTWEEPVYFVVRQIDLANAHRCYKLEIDD